MSDEIIQIGSNLAYLTFAEAAVVITDNRQMFAIPDSPPMNNPLTANDNKLGKIVPWGADNKLPQDIIAKIRKSPDMSTNMLFNISAGYGESVMPVRKIVENKKLLLEPVIDNKEINDFFENNDINGFLMEQLTDINYFYMAFPELILNQDKPDKRKVVELNHKEAAFSRWEEMDDHGNINHHFYSGKWELSPGAADIVATQALSRKNPILDLKRRIGREPYANLKKKDDQVFRYIVPIEFSTPGRFYYQMPYYWALIESGWYDFALLIPEFKRALLQNQMTIKYVVYLHELYFPTIFAEEGIVADADKKARIEKEYADIQKFLTGAKNTGKATISKMRYSPDGKEIPMIKIVPIENHFKGGEYIEDSEEVSNILAYGMNTHASLIGSHGKSKTINGTEARELFIIKQAMLKPVRDRLLKPLYVVKAINKWPDDIHFMIPNLELTTLDQGTGAKKVISQTEI